MTHWVTVYVSVPVKTSHPSPFRAEMDAKKIVEEALRMTLAAGTKGCRVTAWEWSRQEP